MKQIKLYFLTALTMALLSLSATAHDFWVGSIYYNINGTEATVTYRGAYSSQYTNEYTGSVNIPATVTYGGTTYSVTAIDNWAFSECRGLISVNIPNSVTTIGNSAFYGCSGLTSITVPNSVTEIGTQAFDGTPWYNNLPDGLVYAGRVAYKYKGTMPSGANINIIEGTVIISPFAFEGCNGLTSVNIPNSVTTIGSSAFSGCSGLSSIIIPNSVTTIGDYAFGGCNGLTSIIVEDGNPNYDSRNNCNAIIETASNTLILGCMNTVIPNSVITIGWYAFEDCTGLTNITIPNSVTSIGACAFNGCVGLSSINIPSSVAGIDEWAFHECSNLTSVHITDLDAWCRIGFGAYHYFGSDDAFSSNPLYYAHHLYLNGEEVKEVVFPNSITSIQHTFCGCSSLTSVTIPSSVTEICSLAFQGCTSLDTLYFNAVSCKDFTRYIFDDDYESVSYLPFEDLHITNIIIGDSVQKIPADLAYGLGPTNVTIGKSVTDIGEFAFAYCDGRTRVNITDLVSWCNITFHVGEWEEWDAFYSNPLFGGGHLFLNGEEITDLVIPDSVTTIKDAAFISCSGLSSVTIPNSVTSIGHLAFRDCSELTSVNIGNSVSDIGDYAFAWCRGLTSVTCLAIIPPIISSNYLAFPSEVTNHATLHVPMESIGAYQTAYNWKNFSQIVGIPAIDDFEVDSVWYRASSESTAMVIQRPDEEYYQGDVVIPETVTYEGYNFTVTAIDEGAFEDCYDLNSVVIGEAVESIGENAFQGCTGLTSVTIGSGVTNIGAKAFNYCNALQTVTCRSTVPPVMASSNCFSNAAYSRAVLKVPRPEIETYAATDYWYKFAHIEGWGYLGPGDVNGSGTIDMDDLTRLINIMLTDDLDGIDPSWADVTGNGIVSMNDLTELINLLLTQ